VDVIDLLLVMLVHKSLDASDRAVNSTPAKQGGTAPVIQPAKRQGPNNQLHFTRMVRAQLALKVKGQVLHHEVLKIYD